MKQNLGFGTVGQFQIQKFLVLFRLTKQTKMMFQKCLVFFHKLTIVTNYKSVPSGDISQVILLRQIM